MFPALQPFGPGGFGGFLTLRLTERIAIQPEVLYMMKGTEYDDEDLSLKLGYVEVPVLARVALASAHGGIEPHILVGPAVSLNTTCKWEGRENNIKVEIDCAEFDDARSVDFGIVFGGGFAIPTGAFSIVLDGRYNLGLSSVFEDVDIKNSTFSAMAGLSIPLGQRTVAATRR